MRRIKDLPITLRLIILVFLILAPVLSLAGVLVIGYATEERSRQELAAESETRVLALMVERELDNVSRAAQLLAITSGRLREGDLAGLHRQFTEGMRLHHDEILLSDRSGQQLVNGAVPYGSPLPRLVDPDRAHLAIEQKVRVTGLTRSAVTGRDSVAVDIGVPADHGGPAMLSFNIAPAVFQRLISVGSSRVDLQACKLEYSIVSPK